MSNSVEPSLDVSFLSYSRLYDRQWRLEALKLALGSDLSTPDIVKRADEFYAFLVGGEKELCDDK